MALATVVARPDPYTVVIIEGIRLDSYTAGGINVSVGPLGRVDFATVHVGRASGASMLSGPAFQFFVTSGSGNIVTISVVGAGSQEVASVRTSAFPLTVVAWGH